MVLRPKLKQAKETYIACSDVDRKVDEIHCSKERNKAVALVIGIGSYQNFPSSLYSEYDAILMTRLFKNVYGIETRSFINQDATYMAIKHEIKKLSADVQGKDVYLYYSGHGFPKNNQPAIVPYNTPAGMDEEALISLAWITNELKKGGARKVVVFVDACYSGYDKEGRLLTASARPVVMMLEQVAVGDIFSAATSKKGKSYSDKHLRHGIFTYYLAKGLLEGDKNGDGILEVAEFKNYLTEAERHARRLGYSDQKPMFEARDDVIISVKNE